MVPVSDQRPQTEREQATFSLLITSEAYGIYRVRDERLSPTAVRTLTHRFHEKLGQTQPLADLTVRHLVIYENVQSTLRRGAAGASFGVIGAAIAAGSAPTDRRGNVVNSPVDPAAFAQTAGDNEYQRALYAENENPGRQPVMVIYIATETGGRSVLTRTLTPASGDWTLAKGVTTAIDYHVAQY